MTISNNGSALLFLWVAALCSTVRGVLLAGEAPIVGSGPDDQQDALRQGTADELMSWAEEMQGEVNSLRSDFRRLRGKLAKARADVSEVAATMMQTSQNLASIQMSMYSAESNMAADTKYLAQVQAKMPQLTSAGKVMNASAKQATIPANVSADLDEVESSFKFLSDGGDASNRAKALKQAVDKVSGDVKTVVDGTVPKHMRELIDEQRKALTDLVLVTPAPNGITSSELDVKPDCNLDEPPV
mmetsp:Transcript_60338/g.143757  ORF Transcript_60338/g.143757 Transcript_60338/m.143757 type:complete len:243 (+) Transcript_60338:165-893(+)|eukprot:CAMPEP_0178421656 /NCGR_PEP_ID=MMETSP0689_2-20121128/26759_1 /TAXON_ID=160604 /ORGANISM="Amphidinium massartii, Strain CS-259" /LENGTH=242 /DNA_ID=CAMNT_0020043173 /DNA_START=164 /DNA_END=892 /DNA_ORIENTATION=+